MGLSYLVATAPIVKSLRRYSFSKPPICRSPFLSAGKYATKRTASRYHSVRAWLHD